MRHDPLYLLTYLIVLLVFVVIVLWIAGVIIR